MWTQSRLFCLQETNHNDMINGKQKQHRIPAKRFNTSTEGCHYVFNQFFSLSSYQVVYEANIVHDIMM